MGVLFTALVVSVFLFKERIIRQFIAEANKQLSTPVRVGELDVSIIRHFPRLSIVLNDVYIEDSHPGNYPLFTARQLSFVMHPYEVYKGIYNIRGIHIEDSETNLKIDGDGRNNYTVLKETEEQSAGAARLTLELHDVVLKNTRVHYLDLKSKEDLVFRSEALNASIAANGDLYRIAAEGHVLTESISIRGRTYLAGKSFEVESELLYDDNLKKLDIDPSVLTLERTSFAVSGQYEWKDKSMIDLQVDGRETDIQTILSLLPESVSNDLRKYRSEGGVYFKAHLRGEMSRKVNPALDIDFGFTDATIFHPEYKTKITDANMTGVFKSRDFMDLSGAKLSLSNITGRLNGEPFKGNLSLTNFDNPDIAADFHGKLDAASLMGFYPLQGLQNVSGSLTANISLNGRISLLKNRNTASQVLTRGTIDLDKISFDYGKKNIPLRSLTGNLQFSNNDLALSNVSATFGNSDYLLNGFFKNVITFLLFEDQPIGIEADLKSGFLDVDELFSFAYTSEGGREKSGYRFEISKNIYLNFNCDVRRLRYKRFHGANIKGDLLVKNKVAVSRNLALETMGGNLTLSGIVDANNIKAIDVVCSSKLNGIDADSVFYVFENFDQDFIRDKHLKGDVSADVNFELSLNENLRLYPETLVADIGAVIRNGQLNNFEPLKKLSKYVDDEGLSQLRFSDLKNDIHIENKTVYIPQMLVTSNVTSLRISGTHTFDQRIDYRIVTPLRGKRQDRDAEFVKAVELDDSGQTRLFLKIVGTTDEYKVLYDTEAVKNKIAADLKREVKELKDAFKKKETEKKKEIELQEDEYFEWSE